MYSSGFYLKLPLLALLLFSNCNGQSKQNIQTASGVTVQSTEKVGGACETCELIYVGIPDQIDATDTSAGWQLPDSKLVLTGTVYMPDKKTPAPDIILYYWQTDDKGEYVTKEGMNLEVSRHGYIRGWVKTDESGRYKIYTNRPGSYPSRDSPGHIHMLVKEPTIKNEYYIDDVVFEDDPLLINANRKDLDNKGGNGIVSVRKENGVQIANRDIILGLNISNYPKRE